MKRVWAKAGGRVLYSPFHYTMMRGLVGWAGAWVWAGMLPVAWGMEVVPFRGGTLPEWSVPWVGMVFVLVQVGLCGALAMGWKRRWVGLGLMAGLVALFDQEALAWEAALVYAGVLAAMILTPEGEPWRWRGGEVPPQTWGMPGVVYGGMWVVLGAGAMVAAVDKAGEEVWRNGTALAGMAEARGGVACGWLEGAPEAVGWVATWGVWAAQGVCVAFCWTRETRRLAWLALLAAQGVMVAYGGVTALTAAWVGLLGLTFDRRWLPVKAVVGRRPVLLYDGECGLCNAVLRFLLREDVEAVLRFAPLQSRVGQDTLRRLKLPTTDFDSLVFLPDLVGQRYCLRTSGVCAVLDTLGGIWRVVGWVKLVPPFLRNALYRVVARSRYRLFGVYQPTPWPDPRWEKQRLE